MPTTQTTRQSAQGPFERALRRAAGIGALAGLLAASMPSSAAIVVGTFDPPFGPSIPNLGFRGTVTVSVPDACFASTGLIANSDPCSALNGGMSILAANVEFYNVNTAGLPTFASFNASFTAGNPLSVVIGFDGVTLQNELFGINTGLSMASGMTLLDLGPDLASGGGDDVNFTGTMQVEFQAADPLAQTTGLLYTARLLACPRGNDVDCSTSNQAVSRFSSRVPEPGTLALVMAAGLGLGLVSRRRGGASAPRRG